MLILLGETNLVRHVQPGNYYARIRVRSKLIWKSLKTGRISAAKLRLGDFHKEERQRAAARTAFARGKMTFADARKTCPERPNGDQSLKERSKACRQEAACQQSVLTAFQVASHALITRQKLAEKNVCDGSAVVALAESVELATQR